MSWSLILSMYIIYVIICFYHVLFVQWPRKTGKGYWYDWLFMPGLIFPIGFIFFIICRISDWRNRRSNI
jgi:hypothetical protein